jgi:hypothetical protein
LQGDDVETDEASDLPSDVENDLNKQPFESSNTRALEVGSQRRVSRDDFRRQNSVDHPSGAYLKELGKQVSGASEETYKASDSPTGTATASMSRQNSQASMLTAIAVSSTAAYDTGVEIQRQLSDSASAGGLSPRFSYHEEQNVESGSDVGLQDDDQTGEVQIFHVVVVL